MFVEASPADEAAGQGDEGVVEFGSAFPPDGESLELAEESEGLLDDVAELAQALDVGAPLREMTGRIREHLTPGDEVAVTMGRDYAVSVARKGTVQNTADTPEGEALFVVVLAVISAGAFLLHTGGSALARARTWAKDGVPLVLVVQAKWVLGSALCALSALVIGDLSGLGPVAEVVARCAMVRLVRLYLQRKFSRVHGGHARPLTTRSPIRATTTSPSSRRADGAPTATSATPTTRSASP
ncbi:hypothetical protein [Streptomyces sp. NPDC004284]|uniref:hypothetical protein n=1 Tax=Streptomyces sp. NPDC004284 TaxID=3364695 RepID=UPI0036B34EA7